MLQQIETDSGMHEQVFSQPSLLRLYTISTKANVLNLRTTGAARIAQWLEHRTRDCKVAGSNPCWNGGRIFFSRVDFLC